MKSWKTNKMNQMSILLGVVILVTCYLGESEGFFLKNFLSETKTEEFQASTTTLSPDTNSTGIHRVEFDEIHRNISEKLEESSTQIVNSVKDIVNLVLDEHVIENQTLQKLPEEDNQIDIDLKNIAVHGDNYIPAPKVRNGDNDIPAPEALLKNLEHAANDPGLTIVKIPDENQEDMATSLENNIRSSVQDEIQPEQNFETSAMDVLDDIPEAEVRQTLTEDLMAIEYPQGVKKLEETGAEKKSSVAVVNEQNFETSTMDVIEDIPAPEVRQTLTEDLMAIESVKKPEETSAEKDSSDAVINEVHKNITKMHNHAESKSSVTNKDETDSTENLVEVTTGTILNEKNWTLNTSATPKAQISEDVHNTDPTDTTTTAIFKTKTASDIEVTTPTSEIFQEITLIPSEEIVHNLEDIQDTSSALETNSIRTRHMRGFSEGMETKSQDSSKDTESSKSKSIDSSDPSNSSDFSAKESSSTKDENVASEESSEEVDDVISQDASIEESLENESVNSQQAIPAELIPKRKVTPTPRPAIVSATTIEPIKSDSADPILLEGITESTGDILNELSSTISAGKHIVIKKPGVDEELTPLNTIQSPTLDTVDAPTDDAVRESPIQFAAITESELETRTEADSAVSGINTKRVLEIAEPPAENDTHNETLITENNLLETQDPLIQAESRDTLTANLPLENDSSILTEIDDIITEQVPVSELDETLTVDTERESAPEENQSFFIINQSENENADQHTYSQAPTLQTTNTLDSEQPSLQQTDQQDLLRTLDNDEKEPSMGPSLENTSTTLNAESALVAVTEEHISSQKPSSKTLIPIHEEVLETSTETPSVELAKEEKANQDFLMPSKPEFSNEISKHMDETLLTQTTHLLPKDAEDELQVHYPDTYETSTEKPIGRSHEDSSSSPALVRTLIEAAELTTEFTRHVDSFRATSDETAAVSDEIVSPTVAGRSFNTITAEGLGKPLPTRSVGDEPSSSSYSSEDKTTTVVVLCSSAGVIFIAFSIAIYLITFQRQHGTLDIEMQEQRCGKDDLEDEEEAETRVTLLNQFPQVDSDGHSSD